MNTFCYIGDMLSAGGGVEASSITRMEMQMVRWTCSISLSEQWPSEEMRVRLQIQGYFNGHPANASQVVWPHRKNKKWELSWKCRNLVIDLAAERGITCKTWNQVVQKNLQTLQMERSTHSRRKWMERSHQEATVLHMLAWSGC